MEAGQFTAKIVDYGAGETSTGKPRVFVKFEVNPEGNPMGGETIYWYGYLSPNALQNTLKALITMGLTQADMEQFKLGPASGLLDMDTMVSVTIEMEEYKGKLSPKVKWVNKLGGGKFNKITAEVSSALSGANGELKALLEKNGVKSTARKEEGPGF